MKTKKPNFAHRIPFYYGWVIVAVGFITMGVGLNARTTFSLLFPPILDEFGWSRGTVAAAFSVGFLGYSFLAPILGILIDKFGPRFVVPAGAAVSALGFILAPLATAPWHLYLTLGLMVMGGALFFSYVAQTTFLPNWFNKRRGLAMGVAFSGVGVGSIILFPLVQYSIELDGWRFTSIIIGVSLFAILVPLNLIFQRKSPNDLGLEPDGEIEKVELDDTDEKAVKDSRIVDHDWVNTEWTLLRALKTHRFWWLMVAFSSGLYVWYGVQVHQTRFLIDVGISTEIAALALGLVGLMGIGGQIGLGYLSDKIGREWGWTIGLLGFAATYILLVVIPFWPSEILVILMCCFQGLIGYGFAAVFGAVPIELFEGRRYGLIMGVIGAIAGLGGALGPWVTGLVFDLTGNYQGAFLLAVFLCLLSIFAMWMAGPRKVRLVAGQAGKLKQR